MTSDVQKALDALGRITSLARKFAFTCERHNNVEDNKAAHAWIKNDEITIRAALTAKANAPMTDAEILQAAAHEGIIDDPSYCVNLSSQLVRLARAIEARAYAQNTANGCGDCHARGIGCPDCPKTTGTGLDMTVTRELSPEEREVFRNAHRKSVTILNHVDANPMTLPDLQAGYHFSLQQQSDGGFVYQAFNGNGPSYYGGGETPRAAAEAAIAKIAPTGKVVS